MNGRLCNMAASAATAYSACMRRCHPHHNPGSLNSFVVCCLYVCFSNALFCLILRWVCRQAAVKTAKILHLVGLARSKPDPINRGPGAQSSPPCRPPPVRAIVCMSVYLYLKMGCARRRGDPKPAVRSHGAIRALRGAQWAGQH